MIESSLAYGNGFVPFGPYQPFPNEFSNLLFSPVQIGEANCILWLDANHANSIATTWTNMSETASGSSGSDTITCSGTIDTFLSPGARVRLEGSDIYTIEAVSGADITILGTLSKAYSGVVLAKETVSQWSDRSSAGNDAAQGTSARQPLYAGDSIYFDGESGANGKYLLLSALSLTHNASVFIVWENITQTAGGDSVHRPILALTANPYVTSSTGYGMGPRRSGQDIFQVTIPALFDEASAQDSLSPDGNSHIASALNDDGSLTLYDNGTSQDTVAGLRTSGFGTGYQLGGHTFGTSRYYKGRIKEVIAFDGFLSAENQQKIETTLKAKHNIT